MAWIVLTVLAIWLLPVAWVIHVNVRTRRKYEQKIPVRKIAKLAWRRLAWPFRLIDWISSS